MNQDHANLDELMGRWKEFYQFDKGLENYSVIGPVLANFRKTKNTVVVMGKQ